MPIDCRNTDFKADQRLNLTGVLAFSTPSRAIFLAKTALRISCAAVVRAVSPARRRNYPHSVKTSRGFVQSGFNEVALIVPAAPSRERDLTEPSRFPKEEFLI